MGRNKVSRQAPELSPEQKKQQRKNELFAECIFYVMEGDEDKLREKLIDIAVDDYDVFDHLAKQVDVGQRNAVHMHQKAEKQIKSFQMAMDIIDDLIDEGIVTEPEDVEAEAESLVEVVSS